MSDHTNIQYECYSCSEKDAEIERLETFSRANWAALQEAQRQIEQLEGALARADARCVKLTDEITNLNELAKERYCEMQTKIDLLQASCDSWASIVEFIDYE